MFLLWQFQQLCMSLTAPLLLVHIVSDRDTHMAPSLANDVFSPAHLFIQCLWDE